MRLGVDLMGGDCSPIELYQAVVDVARGAGNKVDFVVFVTEDVVHALSPHSHIEIETVTDVIRMDDDPLQAIRQKKGASIPVAMKQLASKSLDVLVSVGNTGALVVAATLFIPKLPGVSRVALIVELPTKTGTVSVIDVGGTLEADAGQLFQFALLASQIHSKKLPLVGLLNIGTEPTKGTQAHREAYSLLKAECEKWIFVGNVEGRDVFNGGVDILVTDGFTGNVFLKTAEGVAALIFDQLEGEHPLRAQFDYTEQPGARLVGVEGTIIKCHGASTPHTLAKSISSVIRQE